MANKLHVPAAGIQKLSAALLVAFQFGMGQAALAAGAEEVATGLQHPWAVAFIEDGRKLVSERAGRMVVVERNGKVGKPLEGLPSMPSTSGHAGLLDLITDRDYKTNRVLYFCFSEVSSGKTSTAMARARLSPDRSRLDEVKVIFRQLPKVYSDHHFGCRIVQSADHHLFLSLGDREKHKEDAQTFDTHHGKIVRVRNDGTVPEDNPFRKRAGALPEIWTIGHRNIQGAALSEAGEFWTTEHGPLGGDELNRIVAGKNYGWPTIGYGKDYAGQPNEKIPTHGEGLEQPVVHWSSIAPSGLAFVTKDGKFPQWRGSMLVGSLRGSVLRLEMAGNTVKARHTVWTRPNERVRDVREDPEGNIYFLIDHPTNGKLMRLMP